jgi:hypothetical protein
MAHTEGWKRCGQTVQQQPGDRLGRLLRSRRRRMAFRRHAGGNRFHRPTRRRDIAVGGFTQTSGISLTPRSLPRVSHFAGGKHRLDHLGFRRSVRQIEILAEQRARLRTE